MPFRPALRPGAPLLRRDATHLQVGTSPGIVIADRPGLIDLLRLLDGARDVERLAAIARTTIPELTVPVADVLAELRSAGVVFDATRWSGAGRRGLDAEARHADFGGDDPARLRHRPAYGSGDSLRCRQQPAREHRPGRARRRRHTRASTPTIPTCWSSRRAASRPHGLRAARQARPRPPARRDRRGSRTDRAARTPRAHTVHVLPRPPPCRLGSRLARSGPPARPAHRDHDAAGGRRRDDPRSGARGRGRGAGPRRRSDQPHARSVPGRRTGPRRPDDVAARVPPRLHVRPASSRLTVRARLS